MISSYDLGNGLNILKEFLCVDILSWDLVKLVF